MQARIKETKSINYSLIAVQMPPSDDHGSSVHKFTSSFCAEQSPALPLLLEATLVLDVLLNLPAGLHGDSNLTISRHRGGPLHPIINKGLW
jgi:hypothetical protein